MITQKVKSTINEKNNESCVILGDRISSGCCDVIKETEKPVVLPSFILEEIHYKIKNNNVKSHSAQNYKAPKTNLIRTKIRSRYWYNMYI